MKNKKWIILAIIIVIIIAVAVYFITNNNETKNNLNENNLVGETEKVQEIDEIIKPAEYITIEIIDKEGQGLVYTEPLKITDQKIIEELRAYLNDSESYDPAKDYEENGVWIDFEGAPITTFYFEDGTFIKLFGYTFGEGIGPVICTSETEEFTSDKLFYKLNSRDIDLIQYIEGIYKDNI